MSVNSHLNLFLDFLIIKKWLAFLWSLETKPDSFNIDLCPVDLNYQYRITLHNSIFSKFFFFIFNLNSCLHSMSKKYLNPNIFSILFIFFKKMNKFKNLKLKKINKTYLFNNGFLITKTKKYNFSKTFRNYKIFILKKYIKRVKPVNLFNRNIKNFKNINTVFDLSNFNYFFNKKFPITSFFINKNHFISSLSINTDSNYFDDDDAQFVDNLDYVISLKKFKFKIKRRVRIKTLGKFFLMKLLTNEDFYLSKKKTFWNQIFLNSSRIKKDKKILELFSDNVNHNLPLSKIHLSISNSNKSINYDLTKILIFFMEPFSKHYVQLKTALNKKKRFMRRNYFNHKFTSTLFSKKSLVRFNKKNFFLLKKNFFLLKKKTAPSLNLNLVPLAFLKLKIKNKKTFKRFFLLKKIVKRKTKSNYNFNNYRIPLIKNKIKKISFLFKRYMNKKFKNTKKLRFKKLYLSKKSKRIFFYIKYNLRLTQILLKNKKHLKWKSRKVFFFNKRKTLSFKKKINRFVRFVKIKKRSFTTRRIKKFLKKKIRTTIRSLFFNSLIKKKIKKTPILLKKNKNINFFFYFNDKKFFKIKNVYINNFNKYFNSLLTFKKKFFASNPSTFNFFNIIEKYPYFNFLYDYLDSRIDFVFLHSLSGFLYVSDKAEVSLIDNDFTYQVKKLMHNFVLKNEMQNFIIKKYTKSPNSPIFSNFNNHIDDFHMTVDTEEEKIYDESYSFFDKTLFGNYFNQESINDRSTSVLFGITSTYDWLDLRDFTSYAYSLRDPNLVFSIKKLKFKPGYQNMWREARSAFKISMRLTYRYQLRLTKFINKFKKIIKCKTYFIFEMQLYNVLKSTRLIPDINWSFNFIQNGIVFVNGAPSYNYYLQLYKNDFIQLIVDFGYYVFFRWIIVWSTLKRLKFKSKIKHKLSKKDLPDDKQRSYTLPSWVIRYRSFNEDIPKHLEVDYFTLSFFLIYDLVMFSELDSTFYTEHRFPIINMYNWKYIN